MKRAIFLDRDGTINDDPGYLKDPEQLLLFPRVGEALFSLQQAGYQLIVVSNQSGIGRGLIRIDQLNQIHHRLDEILASFSVQLNHYALCFHRPEEGCPCRKPEPKMILDTAKMMDIQVAQSYMVGDRICDLEAGQRASCRGSLLVRTGYGRLTETKITPGQALLVADTLWEAAQWIVQHG
jgi:histidinol-phosphate phosphatase family protein